MFLQELGISPTVISGRGLPACPEARFLEVAEIGENGAEHLLAPHAAAAWRGLVAAARRDGIELFLASAYRSAERQAEIIRRRLRRGQGLEEILATCAPPGFSEHHTGRAIDLAAPRAPVREVGFARTAAFRWLERRGGEFGFTLSYPPGNARGFAFEPWHWYYGR
jgi:D-alanyl-D-alanine carboxypeptidase